MVFSLRPKEDPMPTAVMTPKQAVLVALENKRRQPELEGIILQDAVAACYYAKFVVKGRWEAAEPVISGKLRAKFLDFNILDDDTRQVSPHGVRYGVRPKGTGHVKELNQLSLMAVYMRLAKCRIPAFEEKLKGDRWKGNALNYCETVYRQTGELIDLDCPEVCAWMIKNLVMGKVSKKIPRAERIRVCNELHKRMILHSFGHGENREVRDYFKAQKKSENHFLIMLSQHDPDMKVGDLIQKVIES